MEDKKKMADFKIVSQIVSVLENQDKNTQIHVLNTVATWLDIGSINKSFRTATMLTKLADTCNEATTPKFSNQKEMSPKQFMLEKRPKSDVERLACLAYYLTHYRNMPQFKTIDLSKLNTEAAQRKFANAAGTAKNAGTTHYFVQASKKGYRQLSADGEQIIAALPDREAVAVIRKRMRPRKARSSNTRGTKKT